MLNPGYTSVSRVIENVIRDTGFSDDINFPDMVEWVFVAMELIGVPQAYIQKVTDGNKDLNHPDPLEVINYRTELPCDFHKLISIREYCSMIPMRTNTGTFHISENQVTTDRTRYTDITYQINNGHIVTNLESGYLEMSYWAFPTDENGYPMIPDDVMYLKAVESYLTERLGRRLWITGKMDRSVYAALEQDWLFYVKAASVHNSMPSLDGMESLKNQILRLVQRPNQAQWNYDALGNAEKAYIGRHRRLYR